jgi:hypothetical protein
MKSSRPITRRGLTGLLASMAAAVATNAFAEEGDKAKQAKDNPPVPGEKKLRDRGIGGTGVIGTIRGFGSIVVNNLHISYPRNVSVTIDGRRVSVAALKIGHVVQVIAHERAGRFETAHIEVKSEVIGPVDFVSYPAMTVLGQSVLFEDPSGKIDLAKGDVVAVSGLRRLDGTIVASHIERRKGSSLRVAGPVVNSADGTLRIGQLVVKDLAPALVGSRAIVTGRLVGDVFHASTALKDTLLLRDSSLRRLLIEAYVSNSSGNMRFGFGFRLSASDVNISRSGEFRAIADLNRSGSGPLNLGAVNSVPNGPPGTSGVPNGPAPAPDAPSQPQGPPGGLQTPAAPGERSQQNNPGPNNGPSGGTSNPKGPHSRP